MSKSRTTAGRIIAAREAKGLSFWRAARRLGVSPRALRGWETGRADIPLAVRQAMAVLYGTAPQYLVPERPTAVERDRDSVVIRIGSATFSLQHSDDDTLRVFLASVREARGRAPGAPLKVRDTDAALLAETLGGSTEEIARTLQRLLGVNGNEAVELSRWMFQRTVLAGVLAMGLTAGLAGTAAFAATPPGGAGTSGSPAAAVSAQHRLDGNTDLSEPVDPNWAEIGDAAVLRREDVPTDQAP